MPVEKTDSCQDLICYAKQKLPVPLSVIKSKTVIDSTYLHKNVFFTGDTIYTLNENYSALILNYNDGLVCSYQFILIMDLKNNANTDYVVGKTDCDRDGENEYYSYSFVIKNGIIKITQKHAEEGEDELKIGRATSYVVTDKGKLKTK
ncbi:MAG: hypothetical protein JWP12_1287 [Bacteroidetes bacterium]|nr:hypothetical protein [Bacteroidota bacterium]